MGSQFPSHQLSNGLYVSGRPEKPKERTSIMTSGAMPYTGGDVKKSGELGKMFDIPVDGSKSRKSGPMPSRASSHSGPISHPSVLPRSTSGPLSKHGEPIKKSSGPQSGGMSRQNSGSLTPILPTTGLITSGPISSGPLNSSGAPRKSSGQLDPSGLFKAQGSSVGSIQGVTTLGRDDEYSFKRNLPKSILWCVIMIFVMGFIAGGFILAAVQNVILLVVVIVLFCSVSALFAWNSYWGRKAVIGYIERYPDSELRTAKNGQYVKVTGIVTCGNVPLKSSYQKVPRCVYTSTALYEYRGWDSKASNPTHRRFTWGIRHSEKHAVDFYISDFQSGLRALVKTGYGARVTPYVDETVAIELDHSDKEASSPPELTRWLAERNLSCDDRIMMLKEGYIKEGSTVSVMGVIQRDENVLMIVPPSEPYTTGCQWTKCIFPATLDGIVLRCEDTSKMDVIPV